MYSSMDKGTVVPLMHIMHRGPRISWVWCRCFRCYQGWWWQWWCAPGFCKNRKIWLVSGRGRGSPVPPFRHMIPSSLQIQRCPSCLKAASLRVAPRHHSCALRCCHFPGARAPSLHGLYGRVRADNGIPIISAYPKHICPYTNLSQAYLPIYQPIPIIPAHIPTIPVHAIPTIPATPALPTLSTCPQTHTCIAMLPSASYLTITRKEGARHAHVPQTHTASTRRPHVPHSRTIWYYVSERRHKGSASPTAN